MTQPHPDHPAQVRAEMPPPPPYEGWVAQQPTPEASVVQPHLPPGPPHHVVQPARYLHATSGALWIAVMALAGGIAGLELIEAVTSWTSEDLYQQALARGEGPDEIVTPMDIVAIPFVPAFLATWIVAALWLSQARHNAEVLHPVARHARSRVWAWLGWIVPVVSFWFPFQFVRDVRIATVSDERKYSTAVKWWWTAWLTYVLTNAASNRVFMTMTESPRGAAELSEWETINGVAAFVAAVLWIRIVREVGKDQDAVAAGRHTVRVVT